jgi:hypothetical protein
VIFNSILSRFGLAALLSLFAFFNACASQKEVTHAAAPSPAPQRIARTFTATAQADLQIHNSIQSLSALAGLPPLATKIEVRNGGVRLLIQVPADFPREDFVSAVKNLRGVKSVAAQFESPLPVEAAAAPEVFSWRPLFLPASILLLLIAGLAALKWSRRRNKGPAHESNKTQARRPKAA